MKQKNELSVLVGELIRQKREEQGISIRDWQKQTGKTRQWLSSIERGEASPTINTLQRVAAFLGLVVRIDLIEPNKGLESETRLSNSITDYEEW